MICERCKKGFDTSIPSINAESYGGMFITLALIAVNYIASEERL